MSHPGLSFIIDRFCQLFYFQQYLLSSLSSFQSRYFYLSLHCLISSTVIRNYRPSLFLSPVVLLSPFFLCLLPSECVNAFALVVRPPTEQENLLFSFQLAGEETVKSAWLRTLCRHVANTICRADAVRSHTHKPKEKEKGSLTLWQAGN